MVEVSSGTVLFANVACRECGFRYKSDKLIDHRYLGELWKAGGSGDGGGIT